VEECKALCDKTPTCGGFNSHGFLKLQDCSQRIKPASTTLFVKKNSSQPLPTLPWGDLWPVPQHFSLRGPGVITLAPNFTISASLASPTLKRAIARYEKILASAMPSLKAKSGTMIQVFELRVASASESLHFGTNSSYNLTVSPNGECTAHAQTIYGAMYAMETFSQLLVGGSINATSVLIRDWPDYHHRAFMADTGRRFWPVKTIEAVLDAMAWNKLNILHLHLSDNCRFALESKVGRLQVKK
jgi:hexosaminidase